MSLFEKVFNYQLFSRLDEAGAYTITSQERSWLKSMLADPIAAGAFEAGTLAKLQTLLQQEPDNHLPLHIMEKAKSAQGAVFHPQLRTLRHIIMRRQGIRMICRLRDGQMTREQQGFPYKLEYSMVKREWSLLWLRTRGRRSLMATRLDHIVSLHEVALPADRADQWAEWITRTLQQRKQQAVLEVPPLYNPELSRILYAFSCFEKTVDYNAEHRTYRITLLFPGNEAEYVLSKIRFLGMRVRVIEGDYFKRRMLEAAAKSLARYGLIMPAAAEAASAASAPDS
ncbi:WYL domain-containing protein [Paenibacillus sp. SYP-B4298]|uniref:WYL domain-containing protein n=1 Tax=Paenibacillus sp. SYP-B4298 TaxID=2996034 RepID=UPI0022DE5513|nr:WYL domain-containing protein [Paenibacillus sp. SYP-B4298]